MIKIDKRQARKEYNNGTRLYIVPCKVSPDNIWGIGFILENDPTDPDWERGFDSYINEFEYFHCCSELGYRAAYYIIEEEDEI